MTMTKKPMITVYFRLPDHYVFALETPCERPSSEHDELVRIASEHIEDFTTHGVWTIDPFGVDVNDPTRPISRIGGLVVSRDKVEAVSDKLVKLGYELRDVLFPKTWKEVGVDISEYEMPRDGSWNYLHCKIVDADIVMALWAINTVGVDVNIQDNMGCTALHLTINQLYEFKEAIFAHGFDDPSPKTLNVATLVEWLLKRGADPNILDKEGKSALSELYRCYRWPDPENIIDLSAIFKLLLDYGADINLLDETKRRYLLEWSQEAMNRE